MGIYVSLRVETGDSLERREKSPMQWFLDSPIWTHFLIWLTMVERLASSHLAPLFYLDHTISVDTHSKRYVVRVGLHAAPSPSALSLNEVPILPQRHRSPATVDFLAILRAHVICTL